MLRASGRSVLVARDQQARRRIRRHLSTTACASASRSCPRSASASGRFPRRRADGLRRGLGARPHQARGGRAIARRLVASGLIDFVNVIRGHIDTEEALSHVIPGMGERSAPHLEFAGEVRAATRIPTFHAARIQDVATARYAIESGKLDMVGMTRAHLADPHIARKVMEGREDEIRPCVGMGYCIDSIYSGQARLRSQSRDRARARRCRTWSRAATGRQRKSSSSAPGPRGSRPRGSPGSAGIRSSLFEAADRPGGQVLHRRGARARGARFWASSTGASRNARRYDVDIRCNAYAEAPDVARRRIPDVVVVATGGVPKSRLPRRGRGLGASSWDILTGAVKPAGSVIALRRQRRASRHDVAEFIARGGIEARVGDA